MGTYQAHALYFTKLVNLSSSCTFFFLRTCELIRLMHFFDQHANLSGSCPFFHQRANLSCSCIILFYFIFYQHATLFTIMWTYQAHTIFHHRANLSGLRSFSPRCELIRLMHSFSPTCELIKLMHSFFTTVWTYQAHAFFFRLLAFRPVSYTCKNIVVLRNRVEGTWKYCKDENYVVQKPCLVYCFG